MTNIPWGTPDFSQFDIDTVEQVDNLGNVVQTWKEARPRPSDPDRVQDSRTQAKLSHWEKDIDALYEAHKERKATHPSTLRISEHLHPTNPFRAHSDLMARYIEGLNSSEPSDVRVRFPGTQPFLPAWLFRQGTTRAGSNGSLWKVWLRWPYKRWIRTESEREYAAALAVEEQRKSLAVSAGACAHCVEATDPAAWEPGIKGPEGIKGSDGVQGADGVQSKTQYARAIVEETKTRLEEMNRELEATNSKQLAHAESLRERVHMLTERSERLDRRAQELEDELLKFKLDESEATQPPMRAFRYEGSIIDSVVTPQAEVFAIRDHQAEVYWISYWPDPGTKSGVFGDFESAAARYQELIREIHGLT